MTQPKTLTPAEALRALAAGGKLRWDQWPKDAYIFLQSNGGVYWSYGETYAGSFHNLIEYTEPRPTRRVAPYYIRSTEGGVHLSDNCFESDEQAIAHFNYAKVLQRCTALEVTIED